MSKLAHSVYMCVIAVVIVGAVVGFCAWFKAHDAWKDFQRDLAVSQERIKQSQQIERKDVAIEATATNKIAKDNSSNVAIEAALQKNLAPVNAQLAKQLSGDDVVAILKRELPNLAVTQTQDASGKPVFSVDNTQANRNLLNQADASFVSCRFNLDACQQKQQNFLDIIAQKQTIIDAQKETIAAKQATNDELKSNLKEATSFGKGGNIWARTGRVVFPVGCAVGAAWGANRAKLDSRATAIVTGASGAVCAFKFHF